MKVWQINIRRKRYGRKSLCGDEDDVYRDVLMMMVLKETLIWQLDKNVIEVKIGRK